MRLCAAGLWLKRDVCTCSISTWTYWAASTLWTVNSVILAAEAVCPRMLWCRYKGHTVRLAVMCHSYAAEAWSLLSNVFFHSLIPTTRAALESPPPGSHPSRLLVRAALDSPPIHPLISGTGGRCRAFLMQMCANRGDCSSAWSSLCVNAALAFCLFHLERCSLSSVTSLSHSRLPL